MISIQQSVVENVLLGIKPKMDRHLKGVQKKLETILRTKTFLLKRTQRAYINKLQDDLDRIVYATPNRLTSLKKHYGQLSDGDLNHKIQNQSFGNRIIDALGYSALRSSVYPLFFQRVGIKACVYCNSQLTLSVNSGEGLKAKFQVDHYIPKSKCPALCISFFNLYPVCASCNISKSSRKVSFKLYDNTLSSCTTSKFKFLLENASIAKFMLSRNPDDIKILFTEPIRGNAKPISIGVFQKTFDIQGIYDTQKDVAEELILKSAIYTEKYKDTLVKDFPRIFNDASVINRLLVGNYTNENEMHRRPLSKFTQDLARQLKLIK
jgi:5-methylcytosine-specific restriction endonuclease McrA